MLRQPSQNYLFAHVLLRDLVFAHTRELIDRLASSGEDLLEHLWNHSGVEISAAAATPGVPRLSVRRTKDEVIILIRPPCSTQANDAIVIAIVWDEQNAPRYLAIERFVSPVSDETGAMLCAWTAAGAHATMGSVDDSDDASFLEHVQRLVGSSR